MDSHPVWQVFHFTGTGFAIQAPVLSGRIINNKVARGQQEQASLATTAVGAVMRATGHPLASVGPITEGSAQSRTTGSPISASSHVTSNTPNPNVHVIQTHICKQSNIPEWN